MSDVMRFIFGDSHVMGLSRSHHDGIISLERGTGTWYLWGIGGASAHGLMNSGSQTGARKRIIGALDAAGGKKSVTLLFGECDCTEQVGLNGKTMDVSLERYGQFIQELRGRPDVVDVTACSIIPHTRIFRSHYRSEDVVRDISLEWNDRLDPEIDLWSALADGYGYLPPRLCWSPDDPCERHLSPDGSEIVWRTIETTVCPRIRCAF